MKVTECMQAKKQAVIKIINKLPCSFDSHAFIRAFSREFQVDYVHLLSHCESEKPFHTFENLFISCLILISTAKIMK
jgi:hypothetical protein